MTDAPDIAMIPQLRESIHLQLSSKGVRVFHATATEVLEMSDELEHTRQDLRVLAKLLAEAEMED